MDIEGDPAAKMARLERIEREYKVTIRVLAIVAEQFLRYTEGEWIEISDTALMDTPDLHAWRDAPGRRIIIKTER